MFTHYNNHFTQTNQIFFGKPTRLVFNMDMPDADTNKAYQDFQKPQNAIILTQAEADKLNPEEAKRREEIQKLMAEVKKEIAEKGNSNIESTPENNLKEMMKNN